MTDLVERLRDIDVFDEKYLDVNAGIIAEAADEIERLRAALSWLEDHEPELVAKAMKKSWRTDQQQMGTLAEGWDRDEHDKSR